MLFKVQAGSDQFISEGYADQLSAILAAWSVDLLQSPRNTQVIAQSLAPNFSGASLRPAQSRIVRSDVLLRIRQNRYSDTPGLNREAFLGEWQAELHDLSKIIVAEFQITAIEIGKSEGSIQRIHTHVRYELVASGSGFHREQRVGNWRISWESTVSGEWKIVSWSVLEETQAQASAPVYVDIASAACGRVESYAAQMLHGADYWRTVLDGASGIDIYGHNGISVA
ncbi:MAG TPA: hypothetical protein VGG04_19250, partial [Candidatus Sulfotelmatobacter sp.]